jgi:hypothetical protein
VTYQVVRHLVGYALSIFLDFTIAASQSPCQGMDIKFCKLTLLNHFKLLLCLGLDLKIKLKPYASKALQKNQYLWLNFLAN